MSEKTDYFYSECGNFVSGFKLSREEYLNAMKRMVRYANDIIFIDPAGNFVLPKRQPDLSGAGVWFIGGQVPAFMPILESVRMTIQREAGLNLSPSRFVHLKQIRIWFNGQEERGFVHDAVSEIYTIVLTDEEIASITLDENEYVSNSIQRYSYADLQELPDGLFKKIILDMWNLFQQTVVNLH